MKKILVLVSTFTMIFSLAACDFGNEKISSNTTNSETTETEDKKNPAEDPKQPETNSYSEYELNSLSIECLTAADNLECGIYQLEDVTLIKCENKDFIVPTGNFLTAFCGTDYYELHIGHSASKTLTDYEKIEYRKVSKEMLEMKAMFVASAKLNLQKISGSYADFNAYLSSKGYTIQPWRVISPKSVVSSYELDKITIYENKWQLDYINTSLHISRTKTYAEGHIISSTIDCAESDDDYPVESMVVNLDSSAGYTEVTSIIDAMKKNGIYEDNDEQSLVSSSGIIWHGKILVKTEEIDGQLFDCYDRYKIVWINGTATISVEYYYGTIYV